MLKFLIEIDSYLYFFIPVIWIVVIILNTELYRFYKNEAVTQSGFLPQWEGNILVFFTFYWSKDESDPDKIIKQKKALNRTSVFLVCYVVLCLCVWIYLRNNNPLNLWQGL